MANLVIDFKDTNKKSFSQWFNRVNPTPLDKSSVFSTLAEAEEYAANSVIAYPGQIISVVTEDAVTVYKINNKALEEIGASGAGSVVINNYSEALNSTDLVKGQVIYIDTITYKVYDGEDGTYYTTTAPDDAEMIADTYKIGPYVVTSVGDGETTFTELAELSTSTPGDASDLDVVKGDVAALKTTVGNATSGLVSDVAALTTKVGVAADADNGIAATGLYAEVAKKVDAEAGKSLIGDDLIAKLEGVEEGAQVNVIETIKVNDVALNVTDKSVNITIPEAPEYTIVKDGNSYKLKKGDTVVTGSVIDIPEDLVVKSGSLVEATAESPIEDPDNEGQHLAGGKYLKLELNASGSKPIYIAVNELVDVYTAAAGSAITVSDYKIGINLDTLKSDLKLDDLTAAIGAKAVKYTQAEIDAAVEGDAAYNKTTADIKTASSGAYKYAEDLVANLKTAVSLIGSDSIDITSNVVSVKLAEGEKAGNVKLESTENGLKASMDWLEI